jgi:hypothetical protein
VIPGGHPAGPVRPSGMSLGCLTMSKRELDRAQLMLLIGECRRTQSQVAEQLGLSVRQAARGKLAQAVTFPGAEGCGAPDLWAHRPPSARPQIVM